MDDIYLIIVVALGVLAIGDLIVGVSNYGSKFLDICSRIKSNSL